MCHGEFVNGSVLNLVNLSETRTLCQFFFNDSFCPDWLTLIFGREISHKTSIKKNNAITIHNIKLITITYLTAMTA